MRKNMQEKEKNLARIIEIQGEKNGNRKNYFIF